MGSREEQVNALRDFYAKHDSSKTAEQVVGIVDKRRGAQAAVSPAVWAQLCTQLERKYGERPAPPTTAATSSTSSTAPAPPLRASNTATAGAADTLIPTQRPVAGAAAAVAAAAETRGQESTANAATPAADEGTLAAASSELQSMVALGADELATKLVAKECEMTKLRAKAKQKMRDLIREKDSAAAQTEKQMTVRVGALEVQLREATRRAEVRQKRIEQLQSANQRQKAELDELGRVSIEAATQDREETTKLQERVEELLASASAGTAESSRRGQLHQRELEGARAEQAALQVEVAELTTALAGAQRSQAEWRAKAGEAQAQAAAAAAATTRETAAIIPSSAPLAAAAASVDGGISRAAELGDAEGSVEPGGGTGLEASQRAVVEGRVLRERCAMLEQRARSAEQRSADAQRELTSAETAASAGAAALKELEGRHAELRKAWVGAQQAALAAADVNSSSMEAEEAKLQLEQTVRSQEDLIQQLRMEAMSKSGAVMSSVVGSMKHDAEERLAQSRCSSLTARRS
jgi:chromosome segregation ATPase